MKAGQLRVKQLLAAQWGQLAETEPERALQLLGLMKLTGGACMSSGRECLGERVWVWLQGCKVVHPGRGQGGSACVHRLCARTCVPVYACVCMSVHASVYSASCWCGIELVPPVQRHPSNNTRPTTLTQEHPSNNTHPTTLTQEHPPNNTHPRTPTQRHSPNDAHPRTPTQRRSPKNTQPTTPTRRHSPNNAHPTTPTQRHSPNNAHPTTPTQ